LEKGEDNICSDLIETNKKSEGRQPLMGVLNNLFGHRARKRRIKSGS
jgi:hypothetical protein